MSEKDYERIDGSVQELFKSRNEHERKIGIIETQIGHIQEEQGFIRKEIKEYHDDSIEGIRMVQDVIEDFKKDINGIPAQNSDDIEDHENRIKDVETDVTKSKGFWAGVDKTTYFMIALLGVFGVGMWRVSKAIIKLLE